MPFYTKTTHADSLQLLNAAVHLRFFIYKGAKIKLGSVCRAKNMSSNGSTPRSLANFYIELEQFCCSRSACFYVGFEQQHYRISEMFFKNYLKFTMELRTPNFCEASTRLGLKNLPRRKFWHTCAGSYTVENQWW